MNTKQAALLIKEIRALRELLDERLTFLAVALSHAGS